MLNQMKHLAAKYWHILFALYFPIYISCFMALEARGWSHGTLIYVWLDDYIPFNKYFIIPYTLWFAYIAVTVIFFFFYSQKEFIRYATFLILGMSICLIIYAFWPSMLNLRPTDLEATDIFSKMVLSIYTVDTPTNVCPSIHCLNSFIAHIAICRSEYFKQKKAIKALSFVLMISICMSTVFLKQHSIFDGICAALLASILYIPIYSKYNLFDFFKHRNSSRQLKQQKELA